MNQIAREKTTHGAFCVCTKILFKNYYAGRARYARGGRFTPFYRFA